MQSYDFYHWFYDLKRYRKHNETLLFFVNENNGGVEFEDKTFIRQKENRAVIIYGRLKHQTITQTDARERYNVNINYKELHE